MCDENINKAATTMGVGTSYPGSPKSGGMTGDLSKLRSDSRTGDTVGCDQASIKQISMRESLIKMLDHHNDRAKLAHRAFGIIEEHPEFEQLMWLIDNRYQLGI